MRGDFVVVRCWRDQAAVMRVWQADDQRVQVVAVPEYGAMVAGESDLGPTGFPRTSVYWADNFSGNPDLTDFGKLRPY